MNAQLENAVEEFLERKGLLSESNNLDLKNLPFVTVGVCVKNSERTIRECLESIVNSDYDRLKLEIIVVDGNSVDNTVTITRDILEKSGIEFKILSDKGKGLGYARQMVVDNAKGEYICWVDADSIVRPDFIINGLGFMQKEQGVGIMIPLILFKGRSITAKLQGYALLLATLNAAKKKRTPNLAMNGTIIPIKVLEDVGGFNIFIKTAGEDIELFTRIKFKGYRLAVNLRAVIYHFAKENWQDLLEQVRWWAKEPPRKQIKALIIEGLRSQLLFIKRAFYLIKYFREPIGFLMPFYGMVWNGWHVLYSL